LQGLIGFVIPVRNDAARLAECLASILREDPTARIVVMDHGSTDGSGAVAAGRGAEVQRTPDAANVAALRNLGARAIDARWVAFVDSDNAVAPGWLAAFRDAAATGAPAALGALCLPPPSPTWVQAWYDGLRDHPARTQPAEWLGAGNLVVRRDVFETVGGFDESLETCEDVDLCFRLARAGHTILTVPGMRNTHYGDPPTLGRLFRGELWRGRDNLRVSFRQRPLSFRNSLSVAMPVAQLGLVVASIAGLVSGSERGRFVAWASLFGIASLVLARAALVYRRAGRQAPGGVAAALAIAATYEAARAISLVVRSGHHRRPTPPRAT
jgi:glycosyltransferase involved in cell wall biosynthesis